MKVEALTAELTEVGYNVSEIQFLEDGFRNGFDIGYKGPTNRQSNSKNIPLRVGNPTELWNKLIKEVKTGRVVGPFDRVQFSDFIQSPIGLVPKAENSGKTRLIFHLSYDFGEEEQSFSLNFHTPDELCSVKYNDLDTLVKICLETEKECKSQSLILNGKKVEFDEMNDYEEEQQHSIFMCKTDILSAFRLVPLSIRSWPWLVMMAFHPITKKKKYFVDKCLPFGASISCTIFQRFSNVLKFIVQYRTGRKSITNYLNDFLFIAFMKEVCNRMMRTFLNICNRIGVPISEEKTEWASSTKVFLGILLDGCFMILAIPIEKRRKAINMLNSMLDRKKATVKELQQLCGYLNFISQAVYPGRVFTRRMYAQYADLWKTNRAITRKGSSKNTKLVKLKPHHHIRLKTEFKSDCRIWL